MAVALNITTTNDKDGCPVVLLPIVNRIKTVIVDTASFKDLIDLGIKLPLVMRQGFPCVHIMRDGKRKYLRIARLVAGASKGERVIYADRDRCNLSRSNLLLFRGGSAKEKERDEIIPKDIEYKITHKHVPGRVTLNSFNFL